jgi:hypothetical protein
MTRTGLDQSLYPEDRGCAAPTAARILEIFTGVARRHLTALQRHVLDLLDAPTGVDNPAA